MGSGPAPSHEWDCVLTAKLYAAFTDIHDRYRAANDALVKAADANAGHSIIDVGAGLGCTAKACLESGANGPIVCVEPAGAMRALGQQRTRGLPITWHAALPADRRFDRVLCGAALWAMMPMDLAVRQLSSLVSSSGRLAFSVPAAYLGEIDRPGGGADPYLVDLIARLAGLNRNERPQTECASVTASDMARVLETEGFRVDMSRIDVQLNQQALRDWLKLPPVNRGLLGSVHASARPSLIDEAYRHVDAASWRYETWTIWVATR